MVSDAAPLAAVPERSPLASHVLALDGVRGVAIFLVLAFHFIAHGPGYAAWPAWVRGACGYGWAGVDLFFVLSGFLITRILLDLRGRPGAMSVFYVRRALRIFPVYYALLIAVLAYVLVQARFAPSRDQMKNLAAIAAYATNFNIAWQDNWGVAIFRSLQLTHLWTLAIEEQFYLLWPFVVLMLPRRATAAVCVGLILLTPTLRGVLLNRGVSSYAVYVLTPCRADALAWGAAVALIEALRPDLLRPAGWTLITLGVGGSIERLSHGVAFGGSEYDRAVQGLGYFALAAAAAGLVALSAGHALPPPVRLALSARPLTRLGRYSYGVYLFHLPLRGVASDVWRRLGYNPAHWPWAGSLIDTAEGAPLSLVQSIFTVIALTGITILLAVLSFHGFEQHFLRRKPSPPPASAFEVVLPPQRVD